MKLLEDISPDLGLLLDKSSQDDAACHRANREKMMTVNKLWKILPHATVQLNDLTQERHCTEINYIRRMLTVLDGMSPVIEGGQESVQVQRQIPDKKSQEREYKLGMNKSTQIMVQSRDYKSKAEKFKQSRKWLNKKKNQRAADFKTNRIDSEKKARFCLLTVPKQGVKPYKIKTITKEQQQIGHLCHKEETLESDLKEKIFSLDKAVSQPEEEKSAANKNVELLKKKLQHQVQENNASDQIGPITLELEKENWRKEKEILEGKVSELKYSLSDRDKKLKAIQVELHRQNDYCDMRVTGGIKKETYDRTLESLQEENKDLKNKLCHEREKYETELQKRRDDLQRSAKDNKAYMFKIDSLKEDMENLKDTLTRERKHFKTIEDKFKCITGSLKQEVENKDKKIEHLAHFLKENEESETRNRQIDVNIETLEKSREDLKYKLKCVQEENDLLRKENKNLSKCLHDKEQHMKRNEIGSKVEHFENETLQTEVLRLRKELQSVNNELMVQKEEIKSKQNEIHYTLMSNKHGMNNLQENKQHIQHIEKEKKRSESEQRPYEVQFREKDRPLESKVEFKDVNVRKLIKQMEGRPNENKERDKDKDVEKEFSRPQLIVPDLSHVDSCSTAELSDRNRSTNIGERYQMLYGNPWGEAFEVLSEEFNDEEQTIKALKNVLTDIMVFCKKKAADQLREMLMILSKGEEISPYAVARITDARKETAKTFVEALWKDYKVMSSHRLQAEMASKVPRYAKECIHVCWLMSIQDPPMVFGPDAPIGSPFDGNLFDSYTRNTETVKYIVWPVLLLAEGGPLICKGVAHG